MKIIYNKLVRDKIPEIIAEDNGQAKTRILEKEEYIVELIKKLGEETAELTKAIGNKEETTKEMGDINEVWDALKEVLELDQGEIFQVKMERKGRRGGFAKRIFLESVEQAE